MSITCDLYRVAPQRLAELRAGDPSDLFSAVVGPPLASRGEFPRESVEKLWEAIPFVLDLVAERAAEAGEPIAELPEPLHGHALPEVGKAVGGEWFYKTPDEVRRCDAALRQISAAQFRAAYDPEHMAGMDVYPDIWDREDEREENFQYLWGWYEPLVAFYREAAAAGDAIVFVTV